MRSKRNHRELWEQLKAVILYGKQNRFSRKELHDLMLELEIGQLTQDPSGQMDKIIRG